MNDILLHTAASLMRRTIDYSTVIVNVSPHLRKSLYDL